MKLLSKDAVAWYVKVIRDLLKPYPKFAMIRLFVKIGIFFFKGKKKLRKFIMQNIIIVIVIMQNKYI